MEDLRLIQLQEREGEAFGAKAIIGAIITVSILLFFGIYLQSKLNAATDPLEGGTYINTTSYCPAAGTWNGTACNGATVTDLPGNYETFDAVRANINSGFEISSLLPFILPAVGIIGVILMVFK